MKLYTIGFAGKSAEKFFSVLQEHAIIKIVDIRLNNMSQLAGFTKKDDLRYFLNAICGISYEHRTDFAPSKELLDDYKKKRISWSEYEMRYRSILEERNILTGLDYTMLNNAAFLCSEASPQHCHRRLLAEFLTLHNNVLEIRHI
ncbi:MAG: DUF488 domain-containing protein [Pseudomonadota bacterium]